MANVYLKEGRLPTENNDCTVIALAYAFDIHYTHAHKICKQFGRKDNAGFSLDKVFNIKEKDFRQFVFKLGEPRTVTCYGRPKMTVKRFKETYKEGIYIARVGGHIFTMIDGEVLNQKSGRAIISYYYKVSKYIPK